MNVLNADLMSCTGGDEDCLVCLLGESERGNFIFLPEVSKEVFGEVRPLIVYWIEVVGT